MLSHQALRRVYVSSILCIMSAATPAWAQQTTKSADDLFLDALQGNWTMAGTLGGKPVHYLADGTRVLHGGFLKLHMIDRQLPPKYDAEVFIGFDAKANDFIVHWLDLFGAAGARVIARGERKGQQLVVVFPYAEGAFRDTFSWQRTSRSWSLLLESQSADGMWSTFATYTLTPRPHR
jgi:hypothetical protein